jgi:hypothetical protein
MSVIRSRKVRVGYAKADFNHSVGCHGSCFNPFGKGRFGSTYITVMRINHQRIYEHIGYLFYAVVAADGKIKSSEIELVKKLVSEEWDPAERNRDEFDTDVAEYIYFTFDFLLNQEMDAKEAFGTFKEYLQEHLDAFDEHLLKKILNSAKTLASTYSGIHKAEAYYINELQKLMRLKKAHA